MSGRRAHPSSVRVFFLAAVFLGGTAATGAADVQQFLDRLRGLSAEELAAAVREIGAEDPEPLPTVLVGLTFWLEPQFEQAQREGRYPSAGLESALSAAGRALAALGPSQAVPIGRCAAGEDSNRAYAELCVRALAELGAAANSAVPILKEGLRSGSSQARWGAMLGLVAVDGPAYPTLIEALGSPSADVRDVAATGLGKTGSPAVLKPLLRALDDPEIASTASRAIGDLGSVALPALPVLLASEHVNPPDIARIGAPAIPALVRNLESRNERARRKAAFTLAEMGESAAPSLIEAMGHPSADVRRLLAEVVGIVPGAAASTRAGLVRLSTDPDPGVRAAAIQALGSDAGPTPPRESAPPEAAAVRKATPKGGGAAPKAVRVGGTIPEPRKIKDVRPVYPDIAKAARFEGDVVLECTIGADGTVSDVTLVRGHPLLDEAAVEAVRQWVYEPVVSNGVPVSVIMTVTVSFRVDVTPQ